MDGTPSKRPTMRFIYTLMKKLNELVNREPTQPLCRKEDSVAAKQDSASGREQLTIGPNFK
jgi:hypothetical protein